MLHEETLLSFLRAYRNRNKLDDFATEPNFTIDAVYTVEDGNFLRHLRKSFYASFLDIGEMLSSGQLTAFSVDVLTTNTGIKRACVFKCPNGKLHERLCSESSDDIENCWDALRERCG